MKKPILFTISQCSKCEEIRQCLQGKDIVQLQFPKTIGQWSLFEKKIFEQFGVVSLKEMPVLILPDRTKIRGRDIKKWSVKR